MEKNFKLEIISPEKIVFSDEVNMVSIPSYEGHMSVLKDHVPIITFLRPGIIEVEKNNDNKEKFFVEDGTIEYFDNNLSVLSTSAMNLKDLSREFLENLGKDTESLLSQKDISDHDRYILNHKLDAIKEIRV